MKFYVGADVFQARHFARSMVSVRRLRGRVSDFAVQEWMLDSGAFREIDLHGWYQHPPEAYADEIVRWSRCGQMAAAVSQDYMCEPVMLRKTGLTVADHQRLTIARYDAIRSALPAALRPRLMPVLQGYAPAEYVSHLRQYGDRLTDGMWVGVGSVCKRNSRVEEIEAVVVAINDARPDFRLHGFGVKLTALGSSIVRACLSTADSFAWSYHARKQGRDANDWREGARFAAQVETKTVTERWHQYAMAI